MANDRNGTIYIGVTSNLLRRIDEHKNGVLEGFTKKYDCKVCVYYESFEDISSAIMREKQLK
jgi:putative endonuclease